MSLAVSLAVALVWLLVFAVPGFAAQHPSLGSFGSADQPTFESARAVAVDQATGDVLVVDASAGTVSRFHADGTPDDFSALGSNVIDGVGPGDETPQGGLGFNKSAAASFETQVAVDSSPGLTKGDIYVLQGESAGNLIDVFSETGEYLEQLTFGSEPCGVAVDPSGHVFVGLFRGAVEKFEPTLNPVTNGDQVATFETVSEACTISAGAGPSAGALFVSTWKGPITKINSETGEVDYQVLEGTQNPNSAVDPGTGNLLVASGPAVKEFNVSGPKPELLNTITEPTEVEAVAVDGTSGHVYVANSSGAPEQRLGATGLLEYGPLTAFPPPITEQEVVGATSEEATVRAHVNPEGSPTTLRVEYGTNESYGSVSSPLPIGEAETFRAIEVSLKALSPGTTYHYRFVATNAAGTGRGSDATFRTYGVGPSANSCPNEARRTGPAAQLPDCRAYEMVTPVEKGNADIKGLIDVLSYPDELDESSTSGEKFTYTTSQAFGETEGAPYVSQYLATRTGAGWVSRSITPPQGTSAENVGNRIDLEYQEFSPDLCVGLLDHYTDPALAPGAKSGAPNLYRRTLCGSEGYETLTSADLPTFGAEGSEGLAQGVTGDGDCTLFSRLGNSLYETCAGHTVPISVTTSGAEEPGNAGTANSKTRGTETQLRGSQRQGAMSADGSSVYWTEGEKATEGVGWQLDGPRRLMLRTNAMQPQSALGPHDECLESALACTVPVSRKTKLGEGGAQFYGASTDGSRAVYAETGVAEKSPNGQTPLYEFDAGTDTSTLIANVAGVMGVNADATRVYLISKEQLGSQGVAGALNLFLYDATKAPGSRFALVGELFQEDAVEEESTTYQLDNEEPDFRVSRVGRDGLQAVFAAYAPLTGYDNRDAVTGKRDLEVFLYNAAADAGAGALHCISCNPTGQRPIGRGLIKARGEDVSRAASFIPPYATNLFGSHVLSEGATRVFFDSFEALLPADTNGKEDVYEWEAPGSGSCTEAAASFSAPNSGCLSLISTGESSADSSFLDATPDGSDAFFSTQQSLVSQDNGLTDIYDASEDGGFAALPSPSASCEGDACQSPSAPPGAARPASSTFNGPGNLAPQKVTAKVPAPTRAQKLAKALKACHRDKKRAKRAACERDARSKYGPHKTAKAKAKRRSSAERRAGR